MSFISMSSLIIVFWTILIKVNNFKNMWFKKSWSEQIRLQLLKGMRKDSSFCGSPLLCQFYIHCFQLFAVYEQHLAHVHALKRIRQMMKAVVPYWDICLYIWIGNPFIFCLSLFGHYCVMWPILAEGARREKGCGHGL